MVEAHGESVAIESEVGVGTKVTVTFSKDGPPTDQTLGTAH